MNPPPSSYRRRTSVAPVLCSIPPAADGLGASLAEGLDGAVDGPPLGATDGAPPLEHATIDTRKEGCQGKGRQATWLV